MNKKRIIVTYLLVVLTVTFFGPTVSFSDVNTVGSISQYIYNLSDTIHKSAGKPEGSLLSASKHALTVKLLLSPWGELKDAYILESSGNGELDKLVLDAIWKHGRYEPFPKELGESDKWINVPIIFEIEGPYVPGIAEKRVPSEVAREPLPEKIALKEPPPELKIPHEIKERERPSLIQKGEPKKIEQAELENIGIGLEQVYAIALENHLAKDIALDEIELSGLKIREARRALYPQASLSFLETVGKTTAATQDFTDREYKLKFEYPLYYGWRLKYAVDQAVTNLNAQHHNYNKVIQDLRLEVELAYYSYVTSGSSVWYQRSLLDEAKKVYDIAKKRFDAELITKAELLQVESQLKQIRYQLASSENALEIARFTLTQSMNVRDTDDISYLINVDVEKDLQPLDIELKLDQCLDIAYKSRPDLKEKESMVSFNEYERKIQLSKDQLKVDLTGSYGRSGGAFESETLTLGDDWFMGIKVSKPLGGNTLSTSHTEERTSQKHGVTTKTESASNSVEFGILDGLQSFSEKKSADISLTKAKEEFMEAKEAIEKEMKSAYLDYQKDSIQVYANLNKIKYREEELKIAKSRAELNEISLSELMQAHMNLTDEKTFYVETIGRMYQSLAKLNKATGYALFLDTESFMLADMK